MYNNFLLKHDDPTSNAKNKLYKFNQQLCNYKFLNLTQYL